MASNTADQAPHGPGDPDDQKVRVHSGTTGAKMVAAEGAASCQRRGPVSDMTLGGNSSNNNNNNSPSNTYFTTLTNNTTDDQRHLINRDEFSGLQVVEPGLEVSHSNLPEALPPSDPEARYAEYKAWGGHGSPPPPPPPPQAVLLPRSPHDGGSWPLPEAVSPGAGGDNNLYTPVSQPYSKTSSATYQGGHNPFEAEKQQQQQLGGSGRARICGLRRMVFWCVLAVVAFVIVAGVAVGVGVGLGTRDDSSSTTSTSDSSISVPSATATAVATASSSIMCPYANRTVYSLESQSDKSFLVLCGRDYNSCCGAIDLKTVNTTSFEDCLEQCGGQEGCTAVGWGNYYGVNTCWLKSAYGEPNWSGNWYAAVLVDQS